MFINPFVAGVLTTLSIETALIVLASIIMNFRKNNGGKNNG